jgi:small conductance mechanosensitive channel
MRPWSDARGGRSLVHYAPYCNNTNYWQVYFDSNRVIRDAFASARYPVPEQHFRVQSPS